MTKQTKAIKEEIHTHSDSKHAKHKTSHESVDKNNLFTQIDDYLHDFLVERAPELPSNVKETFVKFMPIINMLVIFSTVFASFISIYSVVLIQQIATFSSGIFGYGYLGQNNALANGLNIAVYGFVLYFLIKAQTGLQPKNYSAWKYLVFAQLINTVIAILSFSLPWLFGNLITLYVLYQIKTYYKVK